MLLPVVLLGLSLLCEASPVPLKVAVVGGGPGGSSAAFWLSLAKQRAPAGTSIDITVFEQESRVGGRSTTTHPYDDPSYPPIELGASIFASSNRNMMRAASEFNLELAHFGGATPGIGVWDGTQFVWQSTNNDTADNISMADRYKDGPVISGELVDKFSSSFAKSYDPSLPQFHSIGAYSQTLGYDALSTVILKSYFQQNGVNERWIDEFMTGSVRFNYLQDISAINGVGGLTSLAAGAAYGVKSGNYRIFEEFVKRSKANLKLQTKVLSITKLSTSTTPYLVVTNKGSYRFDAVIIAVPLPVANIAFINLPQPMFFPKVDYVQLYVTIVSTTTPAVLPAYFKGKPSDVLPGTILTTAEYGTQPEFHSFRYTDEIKRNGHTEYIVKIFSKAEITDTTLNTLFGQGGIGWRLRKVWNAYPYFPQRSEYPPIKLAKGLYYVNAMEALLSTMETETISSRNVVDLLTREMLNSGICGPNGPKGPMTDSYALGWDC